MQEEHKEHQLGSPVVGEPLGMVPSGVRLSGVPAGVEAGVDIATGDDFDETAGAGVEIAIGDETAGAAFGAEEVVVGCAEPGMGTGTGTGT